MDQSAKKIKTIRWNSMIVLVAIFIAALVPRLLKIEIDPLLQRDSALYVILAEKWQETGSYFRAIETGTIVPPLPLFVIVKAIDCGLESEIAGRSIALFLGAMIPVLGYIISYLVFHRIDISLISAMILILHPTLIPYSIQPLRENNYLFFLGLSIITIINGIRKKRMKDWCVAGILTAFAVFSRYEALELLLFVPITIIYLYIKAKIKLNYTMKAIASFFIAFILTSILLLSIVDFNLSFITKTTSYF